MVYHKNPLVSVIVPTYNRAYVLGRAINSVLNQTHKNFELVIVDDGSEDNTEEVISSFDDKRIVYIKSDENQGQNPALNKGLRYVKGDYVAFLDSDDEWLPQILEEQLEKFKENPNFGCVYSQAGIMNNGKLEIAMDFQLEGSIYKDALAQGYVSHMITMMVKRKCFDLVGIFDLNFTNFQDDDMCLRLSKHYQFGLIREPLAVIHDDVYNSVMQNKRDYAEGWLRLIEKYKNDIIAYCGSPVMAKHLRKAAILLYSINSYTRTRKTLFLALQLNLSIKTIILLLLTFLPSWVYYTALGAYTRKLNLYK